MARGKLSAAMAWRLAWRAGTGPRASQLKRLTGLRADRAVKAITRPSGPTRLVGPSPRADDNEPLAPYDAWGHDHLFWLDRMVRSTNPHQERMALIWHDWFATSGEKVDSQRKMLEQTQLFRRFTHGSFLDLLRAVTVDPAMLLWLDGAENHKGYGNENYAREIQELFCLGADRGAYTEQDVREIARALTGFTSDWDEQLGHHNFRFEERLHDSGFKTIYGQRGRWGWEDVCRMIVAHPAHASFMTSKLWSYFIPEPPPRRTSAELQRIYKQSNYDIGEVVKRILMDREFWHGPAIVTPPAIYAAGLLRLSNQPVRGDGWAWRCQTAGQLLYYPPDVSGWDDSKWLNTNTIRGRFQIANQVLERDSIDPWKNKGHNYSATQTAAQAWKRAYSYWHRPPLTVASERTLKHFIARSPRHLEEWEQAPYRAQRMNALRLLLAVSPDLQIS